MLTNLFYLRNTWELRFPFILYFQMVQAIQVLRFHLLELEKVRERLTQFTLLWLCVECVLKFELLIS